MKKIFAFLGTISILFGGEGCSDNNENLPTPPVTGDSPFTIVTDNTGPTYVESQWIPADLSMTYVPMYGERETMDTSYTTDEQLISDNLNTFKDMASYYGLSLSEVLGLLCVTGKYEQKISDLLPETDYYLYTYGLSLDGEVTSRITKHQIRTTSLQPCVFEWTSTPTSSSCEVSVQCGTQDYFFWDIALASEIESIDDRTIAEACLSKLKKQLATLKERQPNATMADLLSEGSVRRNFSQLIPAAGYVVFAYSTTSEGDRLSAVSRHTFRTTGSSVENPCRFEISCSNITTSSFDVSVSPSDPATRYYVGICSKTDWDGYTPEQIAAMLLMQEGTVDWKEGTNTDGNPVVFTGEKTLNTFRDLHYAYTSMNCNTEYMAVVFGVDDTGKSTTEIASCIQKTSNIPENFNIDFTIKRVSTEDVVFESIPSDPAVTYYVSMIDRATLDEISKGDIEEYAAYDLAMAVSFGFLPMLLQQGNYESDFSGMLDPQTDYIIFAYGFNDGEIVTKIFTKEFSSLSE